ncbi:hypothetical protein [Leptolyngbya sp. FACHB-17]|nr:hypothetical protein [Leptolyngbya sp. FACHB-17]MBD2080727.1 hypothetical protein [Leptolyngbya sp. FACHB-17]
MTQQDFFPALSTHAKDSLPLFLNKFLPLLIEQGLALNLYAWDGNPPGCQ